MASPDALFETLSAIVFSAFENQTGPGFSSSSISDPVNGILASPDSPLSRSIIPGRPSGFDENIFRGGSGAISGGP